MSKIPLLTTLHGNKLGLTSGDYLAGSGLKGIHIGEPNSELGNDYVIASPVRHNELFDDFLGATLATRWATAKGSDGSAAYPVITAALGGRIRLTTGAGAGASMAANGSQLHSALNWQANKGGLVFETKLGNVSSIANIAIFMGFTDQVSALEMPFTLGGSDALTSDATDGCGFLYDTAADTDHLFLVGVKSDTDATKQALTVDPSTSGFNVYRVEIDTDENATFYIDGVKVGTVMASAVTKTVPLTPVIAAFARTNASKTVDVDYVYTRQLRA